ncbi:hypothetical protein BGZ98_003024 [Dissophora globulifera]|nr:hypothetical protein BGZ98_003024 [Dissophora globulifera]
MAARFLDMALDDVAKSRASNNRSPNPRGGGGGARRGAGPTGRDSPNRSNRSSPYGRGTPEDRWTHDKFDESSQRTGGGGGGGQGGKAQNNDANSKIIVENLHYAVTLEDIKELFDTHAGPVKFAEVKYDLSGRSTGVATISFKSAGDAATAIKKLHGIALDGQPMKITYAPLPQARAQDRRPGGGPSKDAPKRDVFSRLGSSEADIASRLGKLNPVPNLGGGGGGGRGGQGSSHHGRRQGGGGNNSSNNNNSNNNNSNSGKSGGSSKGAPKEKKVPQIKTAEELDAEMDSYMGEA